LPLAGSVCIKEPLTLLSKTCGKREVQTEGQQGQQRTKGSSTAAAAAAARESSSVGQAEQDPNHICLLAYTHVCQFP
jgi:hypothetical protein